MIKRLTQLKGKKGTTLAEVLVAMFITSILMGIAFGMMSTQTKLTATIKSNAHMDSICDTVNEYVRSSIAAAKRGVVFKYNTKNLGRTRGENIRFRPFGFLEYFKLYRQAQCCYE